MLIVLLQTIVIFNIAGNGGRDHWASHKSGGTACWVVVSNWLLHFFEDFYKFSHLKRDCSFFDSKTERKNIEKILKM